MNNSYRFFTEEEVQGLDRELCAKLDLARSMARVPFVITSGLRTIEENDKLPESVKESSHLSGHAVDLACSDSPTRFLMLKALLTVGFTRIGIYGNHLHADNSPSLPGHVIWYGGGA